MTKLELCHAIIELIDTDTTPDPEQFSDGEILDMIYTLVSEEL
jgi:hypothetical protein